MKKLFYFLVCFLFLPPILGAQTYTWATTDNSYQNTGGASLALDPFGNLFVAETYSSGGGSGVNIIKYDVNHNLLWKQKIEGKYLDGSKISADPTGNIVFTGYYRDSLIINNIVYKTTCNSCFSMVLIKFSSQGILQWLKQSTGNDASGFLIGTDAQNNIYVAGNVQGSVYFDTTHITNSYHQDYVAKYNPNGNLLWIRIVDGQLSGVAYGFKTDASGNSYLTSGMYTWAKFGAITINSTWDPNIYIAKLDSNGNWLWAKSAGGSDGSAQDVSYGLDVDINGNTYITGFIGSQTASFGTVTVNNAGQDQYFLAKYDLNGNTVWAKCGSGTGSQYSSGICLDNQGIIYLAHSGTCFSRFDNNGVYLSSDFTVASNAAMLRDNNGCLYVTGGIGTPVSFGSYVLTPSQPQQMYIAKLCSSTAAGIKEQEYTNGFSVYPNPATGIVTLNCSGNAPYNACTLTIRNALGQIIYTESIKEASGAFTRPIDLSVSPKGMYFVELVNTCSDPSQKESLREVKKIVLQ